jgi:hemoglobin
MDATNPSNPATLSGLSPGAAGASLYERIGGEAAMMAAADVFYPKLLTDPLTGPFFEKLNMEAQVKKLVGFMTRAFGGPDQYRGRDLRAAHAGLLAIVAGTRDEVLNR